VIRPVKYLLCLLLDVVVFSVKGYNIKGEKMRKITMITLVLVVFCAAGCSTSHKIQVAPMEVKPIHITIDVNVKVDRALDNFFEDIDKTESQIKE